MQHLTAPDQSHTAVFGKVAVQAQLTVDGGVTITAWTGPDRHDAVSFTYRDRKLARTRYAQIAQLATSGLTAEQIAQLATSGLTAEQIDQHVNGQGNAAISAVRDLLADVAEHTAADPSEPAGRLAVAVTDAYADLDDAADRAELDALAQDVNKHLDAVHGVCRADGQDDADAQDTAVATPVRRTFADLRDEFAATHPNVTPLAEARRIRRRRTR